MATLSLRINIVEKNVIKTMQFNPATSVYDACRIIREKYVEANTGSANDYGLFLADEDSKKGVWLEPGRNLDYYILRNTDLLEYKRKLRTLRVRMLDGTLKTMLVDDSQPVANLMVVICTKIGITNHDEYSLVRENLEDEVENKPNFGTLTLRRKKEEKEKDAKMEQLKKKLKTDDEVNWIDTAKTLREQGIDENETVLLRRKFFFSDQNIDSRDPVQLNLLYVQARDAILDGTHPVTQEKACEFAGIQCHIQFGDYVESKHRPGFLDLKEFLPQGYVKTKGIEKKIFAEHKKHQGLSELEAKVLYTKNARSLKTYGVAFFLVKEKMKGKNKLVPRLLGVTKDSVLRLDEKTKEILKTWPLTTVRRWGASPNTFTLDFGDYSDEYYCVQTTEAEQIQQLIAGYIDIILKKKQSKDHLGIEGDEGSTMVEDSVCPSKATILQHEASKVGKVNTESLAKPAVMRAGADGARPYGTGHMGAAQFSTVSGQVHLAHAPPTVQQSKVSNVLTEPQRALLSTISAGHEIIVTAEKELITKGTIPALGSDAASLKWKETTLNANKQNVSSQIAAMNAATAQVVTLTSGVDEVDHNAVGAAITTIASNLPEMTKGVRMIAALMDDTGSGERLLEAARKLCHAFSDLLKAAEPEAKESRQNLLNAASRVGEASHSVLTTIEEETDDNREIQDILLGLAKAVANTTAALVLKAKNIAATCDDVNKQNKIIAAATQCALATSQLVACSKVVAPTLQSPACQQQLIVAVKEVAQAVEDLDLVCNESCGDENRIRDLNHAAAGVTRALNDLLNHIKSATITSVTVVSQSVETSKSIAPSQRECENAIHSIQSMRTLLDNINEPINDATYFECLDAVMSKSKSLGDGMTGIANHAKKSEHEQFAEAVKGVAQSICGLIEAAAQAAYLVRASDTSSDRQGLLDQQQLNRAFQAIQNACQDLMNPNSNQQQILSAATIIAKHTGSLCNACRIASSKTSNPVAKRHFVQSAKDVANSTANLVKEIKALSATSNEFTETDMEATRQATKPLLEAVENLCTFAASTEFSERISMSTRSTQEPITSAGRSIIEGSCAMVEAAKSLAVSPRDPPTWQLLANHSKSVSDSIKRLVSSIREKAPGQRECDQALEKLNVLIKDIDRAALMGVNQNLSANRENSLQGFTDQVQFATQEIKSRLSPLKQAAKYQAEKVGQAVGLFVQPFETLVQSSIGAASNLILSQPQMLLFDQTKTLIECASQLVYATKEGGGNPKAVNLHSDIDDSADAVHEALHDLEDTLGHLSNQAGVVRGQLDIITKAISRVSDNRALSVEHVDGFVDYQTRMVTRCKEIARVAQDMVTKSSSDVQKLGQLSAELSKNYSLLADDSIGAASSTNNADVSLRIRNGIQLLGKACFESVKAANNCQLAQPGDTFAQRELAESVKHVTERVSQVLAALQAGSRGTQACINAASTVSGIIGDLDTTIMFATAGTLHAENENETFADHRENILKTAKALVEDTKTLVAGAASSQEQLAVAAQNAVSTIVQLAEVVKLGAASLGSNNPEAQVMLINAVKDVATALGDLIHATKSASGKGIDHPSMNHLKDSAKVMVTNVTSLLKTVKAVEDEHTRGTRALEATIEAIAQEIRALQSLEQVKSTATPEDLVRCTKSITTATSRAVAAGNSGKQDDAIVAANVGRKAISDMLSICKGVANNAETAELRNRTLQAGHDVAVQYRELLQAILHILSKPGLSDAKNSLPVISRKIAQCVTELVTSAQLLKGSDWVDPDDPTVIAENELLGAAASIDAAAKKLASLRPRKSIQETDESLNFDEMILEAAKSIAAATSALVKAASASQRELIDSGKVSRRPLTSSDDGQWSEGLISAARLVAAATHSLVESANALVQGVSSEEKLVSSAKQVASSTAQLLVACKVKADPDSDNTKRLQSAGNAVKRATDNLVRAAQQAIQHEEERSFVLNKRMVGGIAQEINARSEVFRIEKELEEARGRLTAIRQAKYKLKGGESDTETDGCQSGYESVSTTTRYNCSSKVTTKTSESISYD